MFLVAICGAPAASERATLILLALVFGAVWVFAAVLMWRDASVAARNRIVISFAIGVVMGPVALVVPDDHLKAFLFVFAGSCAIGLFVSRIRPQVSAVRTLASGALGATLVPGGFLGLLGLSLGLTGSCIG